MVGSKTERESDFDSDLCLRTDESKKEQGVSHVDSRSIAETFIFLYVGLRVTNIPCYRALQFVCLPFNFACPNRDEFAYWDNAHPTQAANKVLAARAFNAQDPDDAYPMDISHLARL